MSESDVCHAAETLSAACEKHGLEFPEGLHEAIDMLVDASEDRGAWRYTDGVNGLTPFDFFRMRESLRGYVKARIDRLEGRALLAQRLSKTREASDGLG
jgi:hypothetical protein